VDIQFHLNRSLLASAAEVRKPFALSPLLLILDIWHFLLEPWFFFNARKK
jgi:hypothetical protein